MGFLIFVLFLLGVMLYGWWLERRNHQQAGTRVLPDGREYTYIIGNNLRLYGRGAMYYGLGVVLPKSLPQIYLDSNKGGGRLARYVVDPSQRISLEGDFDSYFQLYAPKDARVLALSIISPDVMAVLQKIAGDYDVELYRDQLHIISNRPVFGNKKRQAELLEILDVIGVELDQRLATWMTEYKPTEEPRLILRAYSGVRLFGRYFGWLQFWWSGIWISMGFIMIMLALVEFSSTYDDAGLGVFYLIFASALVALGIGGGVLLGRSRRFQPYD